VETQVPIGSVGQAPRIKALSVKREWALDGVSPSRTR
jgi:hypothetical protein